MKPTRRRAALGVAMSHRRRQLRDEQDRGSVTGYVLFMTVALVLLAGLVLDGGSALTARGAAADVAQQAARAGADALDAASLRAGTPAGLVANPAAARQAAVAVLTAAGLSGDVTVAGATVTVTARASRPTTILAMVGIDQVGGSATASAIPLRGITTGAP